MTFIPGALLSLSVFTHLNCTLTLNLIENTNSSELKELVFNVELHPDSTPLNTGTMISTACFGTFKEPFTSSSSEFEKTTVGDLTYGTLKDPNIDIGNYHYQLDLTFAQLTKSPDTTKTINFIARGKMLPLDNDLFIHQNVTGECQLEAI